MNNFNVLVLMEKEKETGFLLNTVDSFTIECDMKFIESAYLQQNDKDCFIHLTVTTEDVDEWEYYAIYQLYEKSVFNSIVEDSIEDEDKYNPSWVLLIPYIENHFEMADTINKILKTHINELNRVKTLIEANKEKFIKEYEEMEMEE